MSLVRIIPTCHSHKPVSKKSCVIGSDFLVPGIAPNHYSSKLRKQHRIEISQEHQATSRHYPAINGALAIANSGGVYRTVRCQPNEPHPPAVWCSCWPNSPTSHVDLPGQWKTCCHMMSYDVICLYIYIYTIIMIYYSHVVCDSCRLLLFIHATTNRGIHGWQLLTLQESLSL